MASPQEPKPDPEARDDEPLTPEASEEAPETPETPVPGPGPDEYEATIVIAPDDIEAEPTEGFDADGADVFATPDPTEDVTGGPLGATHGTEMMDGTDDVFGSADGTDMLAGETDAVPGYEVRPRPQDQADGELSPDDMVTEEAGDFVVLIPDDMAGDDLDDVVTMKIDDGKPASSLTDFLDADDTFVGGGEVGNTTEMTVTDDTEGVKLLSSHPTFENDDTLLGDETATLDGIDDLEDIEGLPDLENVEDITALLEGVGDEELSSPHDDLDVEIALEPLAPRSSIVVRLMPLAAAAALVVAGVLYGPMLYEQYFGTNTEIAKVPPVDPDPVPPVDPDPVDPTNPDGDPEDPTNPDGDPVEDPNPTPPDGDPENPNPVPANPDLEPFRDWVSTALAQSFDDSGFDDTGFDEKGTEQR